MQKVLASLVIACLVLIVPACSSIELDDGTRVRASDITLYDTYMYALRSAVIAHNSGAMSAGTVQEVEQGRQIMAIGVNLSLMGNITRDGRLLSMEEVIMLREAKTDLEARWSAIVLQNQAEPVAVILVPQRIKLLVGWNAYKTV